MKRSYLARILFISALVATPFIVSGCSTTSSATKTAKAEQGAKTSGVTIRHGKKTYTYTAQDRECLERAMFFESQRSSRQGLVAVGTVVMNRLVSEKYPETICGVVGQKNQFAPGVMTRAMNSKAMPDVKEAADAVLKGERHPEVKSAMFFHTAGLKFPYKNMHYVLVAGGNAFYEKRRKDGSLEAPLPQMPYNLAAAYEPHKQTMPDTDNPDTDNNVAATGKGGRVIAAAPVMVAAADEQPAAQAVKTVAEADTPAVFAGAPIQVALHVPVPSAPQHAFAATTQHEKTDAIGALLLAQERPQPMF